MGSVGNWALVAAAVFGLRIVAGDSWGELSIPLALHQPWTAILLFAIMMTISLGCMNLSPGQDEIELWPFWEGSQGSFWTESRGAMILETCRCRWPVYLADHFYFLRWPVARCIWNVCESQILGVVVARCLRILAVIVERATEARENDQQRKMQKKEISFKHQETMAGLAGWLM